MSNTTISTSNDVFAWLNEEAGQIVTPVTVQGREFHVRKLSMSEVLGIQNKGTRTDENGQLLPNPRMLEVRLAYLISVAIVKADGTPLFKYSEVEKLFTDPRANDLISELAVAASEANAAVFNTEKKGS